ncbi:MAG TPA: SDR family oxidoreductase [Polyangiaceae bacterium]|jgi:NADP-dependent 3-hydroxy acid dehydrogenase YdfG|nr:SDR family oxidoreductase [Polyangiaceae bacterium]
MNQVVVITGASSGIGAALAELLGSKGARLALAARRGPELAAVAARAGAQALAVTADVTRREEVARIAEECLARHGRIDVWINNAGRGISRSVLELSDQDFDDMMTVNVKSALYGMQVAVPIFRRQNSGHLINVSSVLGRVPIAPFRSAYSAAKHALNSLTANLRMDLRAEPTIFVSTVHPGVVATEFGAHALYGGPDSRQLAGAQSAAEVAEVLASVIAEPRADVYTRPQAKQLVLSYYGAEDMADAERKPPFWSP